VRRSRPFDHVGFALLPLCHALLLPDGPSLCSSPQCGVLEEEMASLSEQQVNRAVNPTLTTVKSG
jgi:hypothetical protein